jgi:hypothetical protein
MSATGLDVLHGEVTSPCYDAVHARRVVFVGDEYWLVEDRLRAATPHRYDLRFHLAPDAWNETEIARAGGTSVVRAPGLALVFSGPVVPVLEDGWYAPEYGRKLRAPVVSLAVDGVRNAEFLTLVAPLGAAQPAPTLSIRPAAGHVVVEVATDEHRDVVRWNCWNAWWRRTAPDGEPLSFRACTGEAR